MVSSHIFFFNFEVKYFLSSLLRWLQLEGAVGIGIYSKSIGISKSSMWLTDHVFQTYSFHIQVLSIRAAVKIIVDKNVPKPRITVFSDSQAAINALDSSVINPKTAYDCRRCLNETANIYQVSVTGIFPSTAK